GRNQTIHLTDPAQGKEIRRFGGKDVLVDTAGFSPDGVLLAAGSHDGKIHLWDVATGTALAQAAGHRGQITSLAFSPDGKALVSASLDTTALVWDVAAVLQQSQARASPFSPRTLKDLWTDLAG